MALDGSRGVAGKLLTKRRWLTLALIAAMALPFVGFATSRRAESSQKVSAQDGAVSPAAGILYSVNTTSDTVVVGACQNGNPGCSLRGAIQAANSHVGEDGIAFDLPAGSVINLTQALPDLTESVSIIGPGADQLTVTRSTASGTPNFTIFNVNTATAVTLSGMTISRGGGGGIYISADATVGTVNVTNCVITGNSSVDGGGIFNSPDTTLNITNSTISGNEAKGFSSSGGGAAGVGGGIFNFGGTVNVTNSVISQNHSLGGGAGGGIRTSGTFTVVNSTINNNDALSGTHGAGEGGGILITGGTLTVINSTISGNTADDGGGINNFGNFGTVNITSSTISGNSAISGGGILNHGSGTVNVTHSTISGNSASGNPGAGITGGGVANQANGPFNLKSSIIARNTAAGSPDAAGGFTSQGFNFIGVKDGSTGFTVSSDITGTTAAPINPQLDPAGLQNNGGPTKTIALLCGSPAIDKSTRIGQNGPLLTDQRGIGFPRPFDDSAILNAPGGDGTDIGAFERQQTCNAQLTLTVNSTDDADDVNPGDLSCDTDAGTPGQQCTLRAAIEEANTIVGDDTITFNIPTSNQNCDPGTGLCTIRLTKVLPDLSTNMSIVGLGADKLMVLRPAQGVYRIFNVTTSGAVTLSGMNIANGQLTTGDGGGIQNVNSGTVNVTNCVLTENFAIGSFGSGGGISNSSTGTVNVTNSTFLHNGATGNGGGILNKSTGTVNVTNSTLDNNVANGNGGGIFNNGTGTVNVINSTLSRSIIGGSGGGIFNNSTGTVNVTNSTLSGNNTGGSGLGGGIFNNSTGPVNVRGSIIALNTAASSGPDVFGAFATQGYNLIGKADGSTGFTNNLNNDQVGSSASPRDPKLDPNGLQNNGGPTQTIALLCGSPAIDKATNGLTGNLTTDQRDTGFPRTFDDPAIPNASGGNGTDIGAFERQQTCATPTLQFSSATYSVNENAGAVTITVTRTGDSSVAAAVNYAAMNGTATAGADYTAASGTLSFANGDTSKTFVIPILNDSLNEPNETITLVLSNVTVNALLGTPGTAVLTIVDDDSPPSISINDMGVAEGNSGTTSATFNVSLSAASGQTISVNFATANGAATAGSDYVAASGTLTFNPGQTTNFITVAVNGDTTNEPDETFFVNLSTPTNATSKRAKGTGTILNDDGPTLTVLIEEGTANQAAALDSVTQTRGPFSKIDLFNFSSDQRTRLTLFTTSLGQSNSTGLIVQIGGVSVPIENVQPVPGQPQFSQVVVRLDPSVPTGTLNVTVTLNGVMSNTATVDIIP